MTRVAVYATSLAVFSVASILTLVAIIIPRWISFRDSTPDGDQLTYTYGLHRRCSSQTGECTHFPTYADCHGSDRYFCSMWRSVGFLMSLAIVFELVVIVAFVTVLVGGRAKRERGWRIVVLLLALTAGMQCASMSIVAYLYDWDDRFFTGWSLDVSWVLTTVSWACMAVMAAIIAGTGFLLGPEGGYELLK